MSHFSVLVVTPSGTDEERTALLAPFHEFECTGQDDQYVQDVDVTDEARKSWLEDTSTVYRMPDGSMFSIYSPPESFYRAATVEENEQIEAKGAFERLPFEYKSNDGVNMILEVPEGVEKVEVKRHVAEEAEGNTFADWVQSWYGYEVVPFGEQPDLKGENKYGYVVVDEAGEVAKIVNRTNPDKRWDWWVLGGRYSGRLILKSGAVGESGRRSWTNEGETVPGVDSARKDAIDFDAIRAENRANRARAVYAAYDKIAEAHGLTHEQITALWEQYVDALKLQRELWQKDGQGKAFNVWLQEVEGFTELREKVGKIGCEWFGAGVPEGERDPFAWVEKAPSLSTWAFLGTDGVWREKGEMGWFGMSSGDMDPDDWQANVQALIDAIPEDSYLSFVDCHI